MGIGIVAGACIAGSLGLCAAVGPALTILAVAAIGAVGGTAAYALDNACDHTLSGYAKNALYGSVSTLVGEGIGYGLGKAGARIIASRAVQSLATSDRISAPLWSATRKLSPAANALKHFRDHGKDFPETNNALEYVANAQDFLRNPSSSTLTRIRAGGDSVRYNPDTNAFGVLSSDGPPRTYFKPNPANHGYPTNMDYFNAQ